MAFIYFSNEELALLVPIAITIRCGVMAREERFLD
jgi:hypothetical protein